MTWFRGSSARTITFLSLFICLSAAEGGTRYRDIVFASYTEAYNVKFGESLNIDATVDSLYMDVYRPDGDTVTHRPIVILLHSGSLAVGSRSEMGTYCIDLAERGYVAATIDYRLGIEAPKGVTTILEALLRGVQDTKAAVRYFRAHAAEYGIDTSRIYLMGSSAGSMIAVHYAYWDESEIPPAVNQAKWGDIEGTSGTPGYSSAINGIINYCGAIVDPSWINPGEVPVANFHGLLDEIVPPDSGVSTDFLITLHGGVAISRIATQLGIYNQGDFFPNMGHGGNENILRPFAANFLYTLMVLSTTSPGAFTSPALSADSVTLFRYDTYSFTTSAVDTNGNTIILPHSMVQYSCESRIGTITPYGLFTPSDHADSGYVYATFNSMKESCYVKTYDFKYFVMLPETGVTDTLKPLQMTINIYDADSVQHDLAITRYTLTSTDPSVGTIDAAGIFTGLRSGTTQIIASFHGYSDTSVVRVEVAHGLVSLDPLETLDGWTFTGSNLDSLSVSLATDRKSAGSASFRIGYKFTYDPAKSSYLVYLNKDFLLFGIPDSIYLDVRSDGRNHRLYYRLSDADSAYFRASGKKYLNDSTKFNLINAPMTGLSPLSFVANVTYPLILHRIEIQLAGTNVQGVSTSGTIYIDNLRLIYPPVATDVAEAPVLPVFFRLEQNYPNPFNPSTTIRYQLPSGSLVVLKVFDLLGREVETLVNERQGPGAHSVNFTAHNLTSGVYFYRLEAGTYRETKKLLLIK